MTRVAILIRDNAPLFELGCAVELFGLPRPEYSDWYSCDVVTFDKGPLRSTAGVQVLARTIKRLDAYDLLVIPGWQTDLQTVPEPIARNIRAFHARGKRILSFCSGAFLLARLGLLDGREATTHWRYAEKFKAAFPSVRYVDDVLYVYDGTLGCSAGSAAGIDLGIEVIRQDYGYQVANQVARRLVMSAQRRGGQSQFVETPVQQRPAQFTQALDWALKHLSLPIDMDSFAARANMSRRTFDRKFRSTFNLSPQQWLVAQRLAAARALLEQGKGDIEWIAAQSGFGNATTLRHHFRIAFGTTPTLYRAQCVTGRKRRAALQKENQPASLSRNMKYTAPSRQRPAQR
jgi:AraC family transcriptional activator FtrA